MVTSTAKTPKEYIDGLPEERRDTVKKLRALVRKNLPRGYREEMRWGLICYEVPPSRCPETYNGEPLMYAAIAAQKNHYGVYMCGIYLMPGVHETLTSRWKERGTKLDLGKSCLRIASWEKCEPDLIGEAIASIPMQKFIDATNAVHAHRKLKKIVTNPPNKTSKKKTTTKKAAKKRSRG